MISSEEEQGYEFDISEYASFGYMLQDHHLKVDIYMLNNQILGNYSFTTSILFF